MKTKQRFKQRAVLLTTLLMFGLNTTATWASANQETLTLQQALDSALKNNPTVMESEKRWEEKKSRIGVTTALPDPKFGIMKDDIEKGLFAPGTAMMTEYSLTQEIMNPAKLKAMGQMANSEALMAQANYLNKKMEVYSLTKQAYYDLLYASKALEIGKESQQLMGQLVQIAQVNYSTGMVALQDTLRAQTEFSKMTTDLLSMASMEAVAKAKLNTAMGLSADQSFSVKEEFSSRKLDVDLAGLTRLALETKPAVLEMQRQVDMSQNGTVLAEKKKLPDYELQLGYKQYRDQPNTWRIGVMAMLPLWQEKNQSEIKSAQANLSAAQASLANMKNMTALDIQMALTETETAWRQIELYKNTIIPQAEQTYQAGVVGYTNGKVDFMAVLDSLNALRKAKLDYYKARIDYEKAVANLEKAVGKPLFTSGTQP